MGTRRITTPSEWRWRYLSNHGVVRVRHLLLGSGRSVCGLDPARSFWHGSGTQAEYETNYSLPPCRTCLRAIPQAASWLPDEP